MKPLAPAVAACALVGCLGSGPGRSELGGPEEPVPQYRVNGEVRDSMTGAAIPHLDIRVANTRLLTDEFGRFSVEADSGYLTFRIFSPDYEQPSALIPHTQRQSVLLLLRRYSPLVVAFRVVGDSAEGTIMDLQGRKTLDRWLVSRATIHRDAGSSTVLGTGMNWKAVDELTYRTAVRAEGAEKVTWDIHDTSGFSVLVECLPNGLCTTIRSGLASATAP